MPGSAVVDSHMPIIDLPMGGIDPADVRVSFRAESDGPELCRRWLEVDVDVLATAAPWRRFRWRHGQKHFSGSYWSVTERGHVVYESRLEYLLLSDAGPVVVDVKPRARHVFPLAAANRCPQQVIH